MEIITSQTQAFKSRGGRRRTFNCKSLLLSRFIRKYLLEKESKLKWKSRCEHLETDRRRLSDTMKSLRMNYEARINNYLENIRNKNEQLNRLKYKNDLMRNEYNTLMSERDEVLKELEELNEKLVNANDKVNYLERVIGSIKVKDCETRQLQLPIEIIIKNYSNPSYDAITTTTSSNKNKLHAQNNVVSIENENRCSSVSEDLNERVDPNNDDNDDDEKIKAPNEDENVYYVEESGRSFRIMLYNRFRIHESENFSSFFF